MKKYLCPSILSADFTRLGEEISMLEEGGADIIHCDIMDGAFVPNISFGPKIVGDVRKITSLPLDVHLMINNADLRIPDFIRAGANMISVHFENNTHLDRTVNLIKESGAKAGVVLNPSTPVILLTEIIGYVDYILLMSVNPGFGGQRFIGNSIKKLQQLRKIIDSNGSEILIEVDGGVGPENIAELCSAGADMFVTGASIFHSKDKLEATRQLKKAITNC
ncbi:MAG: ribulose-phosphate 3-epimerase [Ignavibacteria bacterium]|nr:ribulose-phosphate 3-epimerase [Ignavibacteria bacterium]